MSDHRDVETLRTEIEQLRREVERLRLAENSHSLLDAILQHSPHGIIVCDAHGKLTLQNRASERIWGGSATADNIEAWGRYRAFHPDGRPYEQGDWSMARCLSSGAVVPAEEVRFQRFDDSFGVLLGSCAPIYSADGELQGALSVFADITAFKEAEAEGQRAKQRLEESELRYRQLVEQMSDGLFVAASDGRFIDVNRAGCEMFRMTREEVLARRIFDTLVPDELARLPGELARLASDGVASSEWRFQRSDGTVFIGEITGRKTAQGNLQGVLRDITRRKQAEAEVERARAKAEAANRAKDEFLAMLGHELRNPLAPIHTALQLMRLRAPLAADRERATIERQVEHLTRLVDDLLDVSRITRGKVTLSRDPLDLSEITAQAIEIAGPLIEQQRHKLWAEVPPGLSVVGDGHRLAQVVSNLLTNAAKYTPPEGRISVRGERRGDEVCLSVRDTGIGIDAELLPTVFDLFVQGHQTSERARGGLGLGLAIVRQLVELHGGHVTAESEGLGKGAQFTIHLPAAARTEPQRSPESAAVWIPPVAPSASQRRVLIVDDNDDAAEMLDTYLGSLGYVTRTAHDGPSAIAIAEQFHPEIALLDIGLPVMDGYELARRLRAGADAPRRLIAVTGYGRDGDRQAAREAGFDALVVKPIDFARLLALMSA